MICAKCGTDYQSRYCPNCGGATYQQPVPVIINNTVEPTVSIKSRWLAFVLCFFFGYLGVHRFYVGKTGTGILYLLTAGLFGIGWVIDLITLLLGGFRDANGLFLKN
jgi:TM2 domain-containing membrane protein YozV